MSKSLAVLGAAALITSSTFATVTGIGVEFVGTVDGRDIYSVYVLSDGPNANGQHDVNLNVIAHNITGGSMAGLLHTDNFVDDSGASVGHWNGIHTSPSTDPSSNQWIDSYVTMTGLVGAAAWTSLDPSFGSGVVNGNSTIPPNAGWYTSNPAVDILITGGRMKVMQIAVPATPYHTFQYSGKFHLGYELQGINFPLYAMNMTYSVGAPDADGDGVPDSIDQCPTDDGDIACNGCPLNACGECSGGAPATDTDSDGTPDCFDTDDDNDGYADDADAFPLDASEWSDNDGDGQGDNADQDDDNDGVGDGSDNCPVVANPSQADCNVNGVGDACDASPDCDGDGLPDSCEIAQGHSTDCNADGIPDTCQGAYGTASFAQNSGNLGAPSGLEARTFTFTALPFAQGNATLNIDVRGDLNGTTEWIEVSLNGGAPTRFFETDGNSCPETPDRATITLSDQEFNALTAASGQLVVTMTCPITVDQTECKGAEFTAFSLGYLGFDPAQGDCNNNQQFDFCEIVAGVSPDCNGNGRPDSCDIATGAADCNANGVPDSCDIANGTAADCNANGIPDSCDVAGASVDRLAQFTGASGTPLAYTEDGITFTSGQQHIHLGGGYIQNHNGCCTTPITITTVEPTFTLKSADVLGYSNTVLLGSNGASVSLSTTGHIEFGTQFQNVSWVKWEEYGGGDSYLDNVAVTTGQPSAYPDCNANGVPDSCDIANGTAADCNANGIPDSCETDSDGDGTINACDGCPSDPNKTSPGICGCGVADTDSDGDGTADCVDGCPSDPNKIAPGICGCGVADTDSDGDGTADCVDGCPSDPNKTEPGICGCGVADTDSDGDGTADCIDGCPSDPNKTAPGQCGCGNPDTDSDGDGTADCIDGCPSDPAKTDPGQCGCGNPDTDSDGDGTADCIDGCPSDPNKIDPGICGCGVADTDTDGDGFADCVDNCVAIANPTQADCDSDGSGDACEIAGGSPDIDGNSVPDDCQTITLTAGSNIQATIDAAPAGEMQIISLGAGTFYGPISFGGKPIVLRGAGASSTVILGTGGASTSVVQLFHEPAIAAIEGVTIRGGETGSVHPDNAKANVGGGVFGYYTAASIRDCVIDDNGAGFGGGAYLYYSTGDIERCKFTNNYAGVSGGGLMSLGGSLDISDSELTGNTCNDGSGGGVCFVDGVRSISGTVIRGNASSHGAGGGVLWTTGIDASSFLAISNCSIINNTASTLCGGLRIVESDAVVSTSVSGSYICGNSPRPNVEGLWDDLGNNDVCDCVSDLNVDGVTNGVDLAMVLADWGTCDADCPGDIDGDGIVSGTDMAELLAGWGECSNSTAPDWATLIEWEPDPAVVTDSALRAAITATGLPWRVRDNASNIEMLLVPPGTFMMGCSPSDQYGCWSGENPVHEVTLTNAFYLGRTEVTQAQWQAEMGSNPSYFVAANGYPGSDARPVEKVSWNTIQGFLTQNSLRLPTEAEWEYAYRAGTTTAFHSMPGYPNGTNADSQLTNIAWYSGNNSPYGTKPVAGKAANALGLHDMSGNVREWVNDWWSYYSSAAATDPQGPVTGSNRVFRGGSWNNDSNGCRASYRYYNDPGSTDSGIGFRVARTP